MGRLTDWATGRFTGTRSETKRRRKAQGRRRGRAISFETLENRSLLSATVTSLGTATDYSLSNANVSVTVAAAVTVNNRVIIEVASDPTALPVTVTDNRGNVYAQDANATNAAHVETWIFSAPVTVGLAAGDHIVVHFAGAPPNAKAVSALAVSGLATVNPLDKTSTAVNSGLSPNSGQTATTVHPQELLIGAIAEEGPNIGNFTPGSGYTLVGRAGTNIGSATTNVTISPEFRSVSAVGQYNASAAIAPGRDWAAMIATYAIDTGPVMIQPANQTNTEGNSVNLQIVASDSDGDPLTYSQSGLPPGLSIDASTGLITGTVNTTFANHGPYAVTVTATDPAGLSDSKNFTWTVNNVAPTVVNQSFAAQQQVLVSVPAPGALADSSDPGNEALQAVLNTNVSHGTLTLNSDGSFTYTSAAGFSGVDSFTYHAFDGLASSNIATVSLNVSDVTTPVITPTGNQTNNENDPVSLQIVASDAHGDTLIYQAAGLPDGLSIDADTGLISGTIAGTAADHAPFNVDVSVTDGVHVVHDLFTWTVNNVAPVLAANDVTLVEGVSGLVTIAGFTDVGGPEPIGNYTATIDWGDGTTTTAGAISLSGSEFTVQGSHKYLSESTPEHTPGGLDYYIVTVTIDDNNGLSLVSSTATSHATVTDPAVIPTGGFTVSAVEGAASLPQTVATFIDPGGAESIDDYSASINWGDGTAPTAGTISLDSFTGIFFVDGSHTYAEESAADHPDSNPYTIVVTIQHETSPIDVSVAVSSAMVSDPPVVGTGGFVVSATEGQASGLQTVATFVDPGGPEVVGDYGATIDWGDGSSSTAGAISVTGGVFTVQGNHTYAEESAADHPGSNPYQITVVINHESATPDTTVASTANVLDPPVIATGGFVVSATEGQASGLQTLATFTDPGGPEAVGDYGATIDWGDGSTSTAGAISLAGGTFTVQGSHTYAEESAANHPGSNPYQITVVINHESATPDTTVTSTANVVDPAVIATGGFTVSVTEGHSSGLQTVATFTDPGGPEVVGDYGATIDWGDGSASTAGAISVTGGVFTVQGSHTYTEAGVLPITVVISHESASNATVQSVADVAEAGIDATGVPVSGFELLPLTNVPVATFTHATAVEPPEAFSATIDWGDGTPTSAGTITLSAGVYTVTGSHTYDDEMSYTLTVVIQDHTPGDADTETVTSTATILEELLPNGGTGTPNERFIAEVYRDLIDRHVEQSGLTFWNDLLTAGQSRLQVVSAIERRIEYLDNTVEQLYERYLHRAADPGGLSFYASLMQGGATIEQISSLLAGSSEFFVTQGGGTNSGFLNAVYEDALARPIDAAGLAWWNSVLAAGASRTQVVSQILATQEYRQDLVKLAYVDLLHRQADPAGLAGWVNLLNSGGTDQMVYAGMCSSQEYYDKTLA